MTILLLSMLACGTSGWDETPTGTSSVAAGKDAVYTVNPELGSIARVDLQTHELQELEVGSWPTRVAVDGDRVFVTLRGSKELLVLEDDGTQLVESEVVTLGAEPVGVLVGGEHLYVAAAMEGRVYQLDLDTLAVTDSWAVADHPEWLAIEGNQLFVASAMNGRLTRINVNTGGQTDLSFEPRVTTRANHARGEEVTLTPRITGDIALSPDGSELAVPVLWVDHSTEVVEMEDTGVEVVVSGYAGGASTRHDDTTRFNPTVVIIDTDDTTDTDTLTVAHASRSYPTSVTWTPDGTGVYVTQESAGVVVALSRTGSAKAMNANLGARGVTWVDGQPVSHGFLDHSLQFLGSDAEPLATTQLSLDDDLAAGQILFYTSGGVMSAQGSGLSCSTCHFEGRNDGLSWNLHNGLRQTPSLAGQVSGTAPISWTNGVASVQHEAMATSEERMGGAGLHARDADRIAAFVDFTPLPDRPTVDLEAAARGQAIFEREDVACASCHSGAQFTDNAEYVMYGLDNVNTPRLTGLAATAPYLHDGRFEDLGSLLRSLQGQMGDTSMLSEQELADLEVYLSTL